MITAQEAQQMAAALMGTEVQKFLDHTIEPMVIQAVKNGKRIIEVPIGSIPQFGNVSHVITAFEKRIVEKLKELGYAVGIEKYGASYVPPGVRFNPGALRLHYGYIIGW